MISAEGKENGPPEMFHNTRRLKEEQQAQRTPMGDWSSGDEMDDYDIPSQPVPADPAARKISCTSADLLRKPTFFSYKLIFLCI